MRSTRCLFVMLIMLTSATSVFAQQSYLGKVVDLDNKPLEGLRIRFEHVGDVQTVAGGEFQVELDDGLLPIKISLKAISSLRVVYPIGGLIRGLPANPKVLEVIVGPSYEDIFRDEVARVLAREQEAISRLGVQVETSSLASQGLLSQILVIVKSNQADLDTRVRQIRARAGFIEDVAPAIDRYVREAWDLSEACRLFGQSAETDPRAFRTLARALESYDPAYKALFDSRNKVMARCTGLEAADATSRLCSEISGMMATALDNIHAEEIHPLNNALRILQLKHGVTGEEKRGAVREFEAAGRKLPPRLKGLESTWRNIQVGAMGV